MKCNICFENLEIDPGSLHKTKPCRIFRSCEQCTLMFLRSLRVKSSATECPGGCGANIEPSDFRIHLGFMGGDRVEARWRGGKGFFNGEIIRMNEDGTYRIRYDDGVVEAYVKRNMMRCGETAS
mmetsp:Transcript_52200/g.104622  ORF Transcript_52200/g.104622 Transcript_52200/m.104622 type:complete len:124 (+) Transcript_52200:33-404(+)